MGGGERRVVDFGKLFTETNEQKFSPTTDGPVYHALSVHLSRAELITPEMELGHFL